MEMMVALNGVSLTSMGSPISVMLLDPDVHQKRCKTGFDTPAAILLHQAQLPVNFWDKLMRPIPIYGALQQ